MEVLTNMTEGMRAFAKKYNRSLNDPKLRALYELELSAKRDQNAIAYTERMEGRKEGRQELILSMLRNGASMDFIYKCANMPKEDVDRIVSQLPGTH